MKIILVLLLSFFSTLTLAEETNNCTKVADADRQVCQDEFDRFVAPAIEASCTKCHDNPAPNFTTALSLIKPGYPKESDLYLFSIGKGHKKVWTPDSQQAKNLEEWIIGK